MTDGVVSMFISALDLPAQWEVGEVELHTARKRIDFQLRCVAPILTCSQCGIAVPRYLGRPRSVWGRSWIRQDLDFLQFEAWLHAVAPHVDCPSCGQMSAVETPWLGGRPDWTWPQAPKLLGGAVAAAFPRSRCSGETAKSGRGGRPAYGFD